MRESQFDEDKGIEIIIFLLQYGIEFCILTQYFVSTVRLLLFEHINFGRIHKSQTFRLYEQRERVH